MSEKRFSYEYSSETAMILIIDNQKSYPNRWSMCNIEQTVRTLNEIDEENEHLKERLYDFEKRKIIEESEINEDVIPKVKMLRTELFGEKYE